MAVSAKSVAGRSVMTMKTELELDGLDRSEWEQLCDGCALCCLVKLEDEETGEVGFTALSCRYLDIETFRCSCYAERTTHRPECVVLTPKVVRESSALPPTCAYRRIAEGASLPSWHPRVSGDPQSVARELKSLRQSFIPEELVDEEEFEDFLIDLPE